MNAFVEALGERRNDVIAKVLVQATTYRVPARDPDDSTTSFIAKLEDYLIKVARMRGDLEEAREYVSAVLGVLEDRWEAVEGWEAIAGTRKATVDQRNEAKRQIDSDLWAGVKTARRTLSTIDRQMKRLGSLSDDEVVSRVYSLISGG